MLTQISIKGFTSICDSTIELRSLNVMIGANGAGKSNLIAFFRMMNEMMAERLQQYIGMSGRAQTLLHFGPKTTPQMEAELQFTVENGVDSYFMRLFHAAGDTLVFAEESLSFLETGRPLRTESLGSGHQETRIMKAAEEGNPMAKVFRHLLNRCRVYHFHDTSSTTRARQYCHVADNRFLMHDAGNIAAVLFRLQNEDDGKMYRRIVQHIKLLAPYFDDFDLEPTGPNGRDIILNWREKGSDQVFGPHQLSDGTLRAMCLITLLLQPVELQPDLIVVDEPELGLHPYALNVLAALFKQAAHKRQILISTQSSTLLDNFISDDVIVVTKQQNGSVFTRLEPERLADWLEEYSLGEIWEKNIIEGGPL
ncbi:MAG: AAA family ATPase [Bacteroidota bacterium]